MDVEFEGRRHSFPDDFSQEDIASALASFKPMGPARNPQQMMAPFAQPKPAQVPQAPMPQTPDSPQSYVQGTPEYNAKWVEKPAVQAQRDKSAARARWLEAGQNKDQVAAQISQLEKSLAIRGPGSIQGTLRKMVQMDLKMWQLAANQGEDE